MPKILFAVVVLLAGAAACSSSFSPPASPVRANATVRRTAAAPTPIDYVYVLNYNSSDVAQWALTPSSNPAMRPVAPNYELPSGCKPDSMAVIPRDHLVFVACYSGSIVTLAIQSNHTLTHSTIAPVSIPHPLYVIAPHSGALGRLYVDEHAGAVAALAYSSKSLNILHTYSTGSISPGQMAFYTNPSKQSKLFVAAPHANIACGSSDSGAILVWSQNAKGLLAKKDPIPACGTAYHVIVDNGILYWAGPNTLGGYSLIHNVPLPSPSPPWRTKHGPAYYANDMSVIEPDAKAKPGTVPQNAPTGSDIAVGVGDRVEIVGDAFQFEKSSPPEGGEPTQSVRCVAFSEPVTIGSASDPDVCFQAIGDKIDLWGFPTTTSPALIQEFSVGSLASDIWVGEECDDYAYYPYDPYSC
jgi:hypothetical protein